MVKKITYNLNSTRATYFQKSLFLDDLMENGCSSDTFIAWAVNTLTWRQMKEIGYHMQRAKDKQNLAYDNRTEMEQVNA